MAITINGTTGISGVDGSAGTPSLQGQDTNTGFFYGTDILGFSTGGAERMRLDSSGNLGLGVTPSAWVALKAVELAGGVNLSTNSSVANGFLGANCYFNGSNWIYKTTQFANLISVNNVGAGGFAWLTAPSGTAGNAISFTQAMTLDASGNLGIGTSSPQQKLQVYSSAASGGQIQVTNSSTGAASTDGVLFGYDGSNDVIINNQEATATKFYTSGSERMRIDSSGNLLVGTNTQFLSGKFCVNGQSAFKGATNQNLVISGAVALSNAVAVVGVNDTFTANVPMEFRYDTTTAWYNSGAEVARFQAADFLVGTTSYSSTTDGTIVAKSGIAQTSNSGFNYIANKPASPAQTAWMTFFVNGALQGYINYINPGCAFVNASDARLKENIVDAVSALDMVAQLPVRSFDWKENGSHEAFGFVAQELHAVYPNAAAVGKDKEDGEIEIPWGVDPSKLVAMLAKAIQELKAEIDELKAKVN